MHKAVTLGLAAICLGVPLTYVIAGSREPQAVAVAQEPRASERVSEDVSTQELSAQLHFVELEPIGTPVRRGPYYVWHALDARGRKFRVVADADLGDILSVFPLRQPRWHLEGGPRIIHVPDANAHVSAREPEPGDFSADEEPIARPQSAEPHRRVRKIEIPHAEREPAKGRRPYSKASAVALPPEAAAEHRSILSAPPPAPAAALPQASAPDPLTPIYATPKFGSKDQPPAAPAVVDVSPPPARPRAEAAPVDAASAPLATQATDTAQPPAPVSCEATAAMNLPC
jgi:hypothetical protein